jgi:hypothetical protein
MLIRKIRDQEIIEANNLSAMSFHWVHDTQGATPEQYVQRLTDNPSSNPPPSSGKNGRPSTRTGRMMSCVGVLPYQVFFDGHTADMVGIGGVCTYPQYRRRGAVREARGPRCANCTTGRALFPIFIPSASSFNARYGYSPSCSAVEWTFDMHTIPAYTGEGSFSRSSGRGRSARLRGGLRKVCRRHQPDGPRDRFDWDAVRTATPLKPTSPPFSTGTSGASRAAIWYPRAGRRKGLCVRVPGDGL